MRKPWRTTFAERDYQQVRELGDEHRRNYPRRIATQRAPARASHRARPVAAAIKAARRRRCALRPRRASRVKNAHAELTGIRISAGSRDLAEEIVEVTTRATGERARAPLDDAVAHLRKLLAAAIGWAVVVRTRGGVA